MSYSFLTWIARRDLKHEDWSLGLVMKSGLKYYLVWTKHGAPRGPEVTGVDAPRTSHTFQDSRSSSTSTSNCPQFISQPSQRSLSCSSPSHTSLSSCTFLSSVFLLSINLVLLHYLPAILPLSIFNSASPSAIYTTVYIITRKLCFTTRYFLLDVELPSLR